MSSIETRVPTRRTVVGGIAAGAGLAISDNSAGLSQDREAWKTFMLVHGAWHGGWCWRRVADRLEGRGHKVFTPTMTGLGERSHLLDAKVNLTTHVTDIVNAIKWEGLGEVVLVGHSYAGSVISVVAEKMEPAIASIVFLDAAMPKDGESPADGAVPRVRQAIDDTLRRGELSIQPPKAAFFRVNEMGSRVGG
jgi:pimeloyl-ACP methyl ester carboxylesterase